MRQPNPYPAGIKRDENPQGASIARVKFGSGRFASARDLEVLEVDGKNILDSCVEFRMTVLAGELVKFEAICTEFAGAMHEPARYRLLTGVVEIL